MKSAFKSLLAVVALFVTLVTHSSPLHEISQSERIQSEKEALVPWVIDNSHKQITEAKAKRIIEYVYEFAFENNLDPILLLAIAKNESGFRERAKSSAGAVGMMQVIPRYHREKINKRDPMTMRVSIDVGSKIIREYIDKANNSLRKALNLYSGGGGKKYYAKVSKTHKEIATHLIEYSFVNERPIYAMHNIDKPIINKIPAPTYAMIDTNGE